MPTFGESLIALEERFFVGREHELDVFRTWLSSENRSAGILNVSGPGGVGKSTLLRAFQNIAKSAGRPVVFVDGRVVRATANGLLQILGRTDLTAVVERLNNERPLLMFDTFEELEDLTPFLRDDLLPRLDLDVPVVVAGRLPLGLAWSGQWAWHQLNRPLPISAFALDERQAYLARRGVDQRSLSKEILVATAGHPLAMALATDLAQQFGVRHFRPAAEWSGAINILVERLLLDIRDSQLRALLEAAAVVQEFDEAMLRDLAGDQAVERAFDQLCRLSMVRPSRWSLTLHDDVRRILTDDLRARRPDRYRELRLRALDHYRQRARSAPWAEQERLLMARYALWENTVVQAMLFSSGERGDVWLEPGERRDQPAIQEIWRSFCEKILPTLAQIDADLPAEYDWLDALMEYAGTRLRIARGSDGDVLGFSVIVPLCRDSVPLLEHRLRVSTLWHAAVGVSSDKTLPETDGESGTYCLIHVAASDKQTEATRAALARDLFSVLASSGLYLAHTPIVGYKQLMEAMGWQRVPAARHHIWGPECPSDGYLLDLRRIGVEVWIESLIGKNSGDPQVAVGTTKATATLTKREREIAGLIAQGLNNREIAEALVLSGRTVERHIENLYDKLGLRGKAARATVAALVAGNRLN